MTTRQHTQVDYQVKLMMLEAAHYFDKGRPLPVDLYMALTDAGIDIDELEEKFDTMEYWERYSDTLESLNRFS